MKRILYIGNKLAKSGINPTTIDILGEKLKEDFDVTCISEKRNQIFRLLDMWISLVKLRNDVDLVLIDTYSTSAFHFAWTTGFIAKFFGIPYIPFLHGGNLPIRAQNSRMIFNLFLSHAAAVVTPSNYLKSRLNNSGIKIRLIPNFLDLNKYPFAERRNTDNINILWVRAFAKIYNPQLAIFTLNALVEKGYNNVHLSMVGPDKDGSFSETRELAEKLGILHLVTFMGKTSKKKWIAFSKEHNIFINTSLADNTPVSVMEAMVLGLPVVTTNVGGIPYMIESKIDGLIVNNNDEEAMSEAIISLHNDNELYQKISMAARKKAVDWDWLVIRKKWLNLITQIAKD